jgi:outer membrane protein assembly factor BamB
VILLLGLAACDSSAGDTTRDTGVPDTRPAFVDSLDPDGEHILVSSLIYLDGHALEELRPDLTSTWSYDLPPESGAQGAVRLEDGSTVFARTLAPPLFSSSFDLIDATGAIVWSYDDLAAVGFFHGVQPTPAGDFVGLDTVSGAVISFDAAGTLLWSMGVSDAGADYHPNGISLFDYGDGDVRIAVSMLERTGNGDPDYLAVYTLGARDEVPTRVWRVPVAGFGGDGAWPHGPRLQADGSVTVCHSANGQVVGYDGVAGDELWRVPATGAPPLLAFPRDALFLSDGTLVVADAGAEVVRVDDAFGDPRVVAATQAPGVFGLSPIACGAGGGIPCLGDPAR